MVSRFDMYNKKGMVMMMIARDLLTYSPGDRIETVSSYTKKLDTSRGVVQQVLQTLEGEKAIERAKRGTLGTYLSQIDYKKLWEFTSWGALTGVSPLPYTKRHEGIATAIYCEIEKKGIPFHFAYMQGAKNRVRGVLDGKYDFAVLTKESANMLMKKYDNLSIAIELAPYSYLSGYVIIYKNKDVLKKDKVKIGRDMDSPDHLKWIEYFVKEQEVEFVDLQYTRIIPAIVDGTIDAAVYNKDAVDRIGILGKLYFKDIDIGKNIGDETRAVLVINNESYGILNLLKQIIHKEEVDSIQKEVIDGIRIPVY